MSADPTVKAEVFCNFEDYILQFQSVKILLRNSVKAKESAEDVSGNCSGGVTVTIVIDCGDDALLKIIGIFECAVHADCKRFTLHPALSKLPDRVKVVSIFLGKGDSFSD